MSHDISTHYAGGKHLSHKWKRPHLTGSGAEPIIQKESTYHTKGEATIPQGAAPIIQEESTYHTKGEGPIPQGAVLFIQEESTFHTKGEGPIPQGAVPMMSLTMHSLTRHLWFIKTLTFAAVFENASISMYVRVVIGSTVKWTACYDSVAFPGIYIMDEMKHFTLQVSNHSQCHTLKQVSNHPLCHTLKQVSNHSIVILQSRSVTILCVIL